jgi:hypothetical protein
MLTSSHRTLVDPSRYGLATRRASVGRARGAGTGGPKSSPREPWLRLSPRALMDGAHTEGLPGATTSDSSTYRG